MKISEFQRRRGDLLLTRRLAELRESDPGMVVVQDLRPNLPLVSVRATTGTGLRVEVLLDPLSILAGIQLPPPKIDDRFAAPADSSGWA